MRCFITGGNGFIGSALARRLLKENHEVMIYDNFSSSNRDLMNPELADPNTCDRLWVVDGDVVNNNQLVRVVDWYKPDVIVHLAAELSIYDANNNPQKAIDVNVGGSLNVFRVAVKHGVKVIMAESSAVYENCEAPLTEDKSNPTTMYACTKSAAAIIAAGMSRTHGLKFNMIRYFNVTGSGIDYNRTVPPLFAGVAIRLLGDNPVIIFGDETRRRDFVHIDDVTDFNMLLLTSGNKYDNLTFNVGRGDSFSLKNIAELSAVYLGKNLKIVHYPEINGEAHTIVADMTHTKTVTGWVAKRDIVDMVKESCDYCKKAIEEGRINAGNYMSSLNIESVKIGN